MSDREDVDFSYDEDADDEVPQLVIDAEHAYISKKYPSIRSTADAFGFAHGTMMKIAARRNWANRRKQAQLEAGRKLAALVDAATAEQIADDFMSIRHNTLKAGKIAAQAAMAYFAREAQELQEALKRGERIRMPSRTVEILKLAIQLEPKLTDANTDTGNVMDIDALAERIAENRARHESMDGLDILLDIDEPEEPALTAAEGEVTR